MWHLSKLHETGNGPEPKAINTGKPQYVDPSATPNPLHAREGDGANPVVYTGVAHCELGMAILRLTCSILQL